MSVRSPLPVRDRLPVPTADRHADRWHTEKSDSYRSTAVLTDCRGRFSQHGCWLVRVFSKRAKELPGA